MVDFDKYAAETHVKAEVRALHAEVARLRELLGLAEEQAYELRYEIAKANDMGDLYAERPDA